jgi:hypothetical protein
MDPTKKTGVKSGAHKTPNVYLSVSLDCSFLIAPSVFSNVYLSVSLDCSFLIAPSVFSNVYLSVSLDCSLTQCVLDTMLGKQTEIR